ncbi:mitochondrial fission ELM1 family protein [Hellea balneolensis]|uniref:mitochondrial fission ELM1 family protein n=1 Tax=Hellea balneolensis TaxID=287478 RepID=UPI00040F8DDF|nr:mitochondrial fission ELM1 family protein [Hellea balneolensis]
MTDDALTCFVISDGRRGIENQALGLAEAAGQIHPLDIVTHKIENGAAFKAASPTLQFAMKSKPSDYGLTGIPPQIAIGCGRQAIAPLLALKKQDPETFAIYVQDPRMDTDRFDLVIAPKHDNISGPNVETMLGSPNRVTKAEIAGQTLSFKKELNKLPMPRAAMLIGGVSKTHNLDKEVHRIHMEAADKIITQGYSLMITTSRRTPDWAIKDYRKLASDHDNVWGYFGDGPNPYFAFLGGAEILLVTEDSTNMLTEAASTGKIVLTLPMHGKAGKFKHLYQSLEARCNIRPYDGTLTAEPYTPLKETQRIAERLWAHYEARTAAIN